MRKWVHVGYWFLVFCIPLGMFLWGMQATGIYPFGEQSILSEDLRIQYIDFYTWYRDVLLGDGDLFYSFALSLGTNMWGLFSYYLSSPFNLLIVFFDEQHITDFIALVTMLKLACANVNMVLYLRKRFGLNRGMALALGICFTYSMWTIVQTRNILWLDALILLPLIAYGLRSFVRKGSWRLLVASLAIAIVTCWYTAYMMILFSFVLILLELYLFHVEESEITRKQVARKLLRFGGLLVLALCLSMFAFLPTVLAMMSSGGTSIGEGFSWKSVAAFAVLVPLGIAAAFLFASQRISLTVKCLAFGSAVCAVFLLSFFFGFVGHTSFAELVSCFFYGNQRGGVTPQFFSGTMIMVLVALFFLAHSIPRRVKLMMAALLFLMVMSAWNDHLYLIWCGFKAPYGFYSRIAFLFVFLSIYAAAYALCRMQRDEVSLRELAYAVSCVVGVGLVLFLVGGFVYPGNFGVSLASAVLCGGALAVYVLRKDARCARTAACSFLVVLAIVEQGSLVQKEWPLFYADYTQQYHDAYVEEARAQQAELRAYDDSWYREEKTRIREEPCSLNESLSGGYMQLSSYTSTSNYAAVGFLNALGYSNEGEFSTRYREPILPSDSLLGVKYVSASQAPIGFSETGLSATAFGDRMYENPYALGFGYEVDEAAADLSLDEYDNPFERQNALISAFVGYEVECYVRAEATLVRDDADAKIWSIDVPARTFASFYVESSKDVPVQVSVDQSPEYLENTRFQHAIHAIGPVSEKSSTHEVAFTPAEGVDAKTGLEIEQVVYAEPLVYSFDFEAFEEAIANLEDRRFVLEAFEDGSVRATYTAEAATQLMLSLPNAAGWSLTVNGEPREPVGLCDGALMGVALGEGENVMELTYRSPGIVEGGVIAGVTLLGLVGFWFSPANRIRRGRSAQGRALRANIGRRRSEAVCDRPVRSGFGP